MIDCDVDLEGIDKWTVVEWLDKRAGWRLYGETAARVTDQLGTWRVTFNQKLDTIPDPADAPNVVTKVARTEDTDIDDVAQDLRDYVDTKEANSD